MALEELKKRLTEAEAAYHKLMLGEKEVSLTIGGFGATTYNQISKKDLEAYINSLKNDIAKTEGKPSRRIIRVAF